MLFLRKIIYYRHIPILVLYKILPIFVLKGACKG